MRDLIALLNVDKYYGQSKTIEFAKGSHDIKKGFWFNFKRQLQWRLKRL